MIRHLLLPLVAFGLVSLILATPDLRAQANPDWHRPFPAFKIAGNLYYVGTADLAVYLIHTPQGNILINSDFKEDVPLVHKSIEQLGFKYADTKILLISHAHSDHDEGVGLIKQETGAKLMVMDADVREEESTAPGRRSCFARWRYGRAWRRHANRALDAWAHQRLYDVDDASA
jgi:metallo-beta-lactamase class B